MSEVLSTEETTSNVETLVRYSSVPVLLALSATLAYKALNPPTLHQKYTDEERAVRVDADYRAWVKKFMPKIDRPNLHRVDFYECRRRVAIRLYQMLIIRATKEQRDIMISAQSLIIDDLQDKLYDHDDIVYKIWDESLAQHTEDDLVDMNLATKISLLETSITRYATALDSDVKEVLKQHNVQWSDQTWSSAPIDAKARTPHKD